MTRENARRDRRFSVQIPVTILSLRGDVRGVIANASFRGVLIRTEESPPARQLVRLRLALPGRPAEMVMNAMIVHLASVGPGVSEVGASFYGLDGEPRAAWEKFIQSVQTSEQPSPEAKLRSRLLADRGADTGSPSRSRISIPPRISSRPLPRDVSLRPSRRPPPLEPQRANRARA